MTPAAKKKEPRPKPHPVFTQEPLAVSIDEAAYMVSVSRTRFYTKYVKPGYVHPLNMGDRVQVVDVAELRAAYAKLRGNAPRETGG
jgi:hypothetical protein